MSNRGTVGHVQQRFVSDTFHVADSAADAAHLAASMASESRTARHNKSNDTLLDDCLRKLLTSTPADPHWHTNESEETGGPARSEHAQAAQALSLAHDGTTKENKGQPQAGHRPASAGAAQGRRVVLDTPAAPHARPETAAATGARGLHRGVDGHSFEAHPLLAANGGAGAGGTPPGPAEHPRPAHGAALWGGPPAPGSVAVARATPAAVAASNAAGAVSAPVGHRGPAPAAGAAAPGPGRPRYSCRSRLARVRELLCELTATQPRVARWATRAEASAFSFAVRDRAEFCRRLYGAGDARKWASFVRLCTDYGISRSSSTSQGWTTFRNTAFHSGASAAQVSTIPSRRKSRSARAVGSPH